VDLADLQVECRDGIVIARIDGEIDMSNANRLGNSLTGHLTNDMLGLVIDMAGVRYIDSAGIQVVYELSERLKSRNQGLRLVVPPDSVVARTLELVNASDTIGVVDSADDAMAALSSSGKEQGHRSTHTRSKS
jgi:anti-sigma B factor antagonist